LQQALELVNEEERVSKKKVVEKTKPVALRRIEPIEIGRPPVANWSTVKTDERQAKLLIETSVTEQSGPYVKDDDQATRSKTQGTGDNEQSTGDKAEVTGNGQLASNQQPTTGKQKSETTKLGALDKIRSQVRGNGSAENGSVVKPIQTEELQLAWNEYASQLKKEKNPAGQNFEMAELRVQDANNFIALVSNNIQLRFIEQQGLKVSQFLREKLCNSQLQFYIVMQENLAQQSSVEAPLTSREQFQKMVEQYPLIKELKDRLRLELDY
jgi:DNA polymerase-3 subunit gamma/tau